MSSSIARLLLALLPLAAGCIETSAEPAEQPCVARGCEELRPACGPALDDGCGNFLDCSRCEEGKLCLNGACGCDSAPTCESVGRLRCGSITNACGVVVECGLDCPFGTTCEAGAGLCGRSCSGPADCPGLAGCDLARGFCLMSNDCDTVRCGAVELASSNTTERFTCGCADGWRCDEADSRCRCDVDADQILACDGRCGGRTFCEGSPIECAPCELGRCDEAHGRCRAGVRPAAWEADPVALLDATRFPAGAPRSVSAHRLADGIELWVVAGINAESRLYRVEFEPDGRTIRGGITAAPLPPPAYAYPFASPPTLSLDGTLLWILHGDVDGSTLPRVHVAEIDPVTRTLGESRPSALAVPRSLGLLPILDSRTALVATYEADQPTRPELPPREYPPFAGRLTQVARPAASAPEDGFRERLGEWNFDEPTVNEWIEPLDGNQIGGLQRGCDGLSLTFDWIEGGVLPGAGLEFYAGVLEIDPAGPPGSIPVRPLPIRGLALWPTGTLLVSEVAGCERAYVLTSVTGGSIHVATPAP